MNLPAHHVVRVICDRPALRVAGILAPESTPFNTGGRGGWLATPRMRRSAVVEWGGPSEETSELSLRLHAEFGQGDVTQMIANLERMARMPSDGVAPPRIRIGGLVPQADRVWVIQELAFDETQREPDGSYTSCVVTLSLLLAENTGDGVVVGGRVPTVHRVKKGDTIAKLAVRYYGSSKHAGALLKAQSSFFRKKYRDVRKALPIKGLGSRVKIP